MKDYQAFLLRTVCAIAFSSVMCSVSRAQVIDIVANAGNSANTVLGTQRYAVNENIYTEAEIGAGNFTGAAVAINKLALNVNAVGADSAFTSVVIRMKNIPAGTTVFTTGTFDTTGYTAVYRGSILLDTIGWVPVILQTPFQRVGGTNLQVMIERTDGVAHSGYTYRFAGGHTNDAAANSSRRYNGATPISATTSLTASIFRAQIRFQHVYPADAMVQQVYTLGKLPIPFSIPHTIRANIANVGANPLTNIPVTLNVTGANAFTDTKAIASLAAGASIDVSFAAFNPTALGNNTVTVSIGNDDFNGNNSQSVAQTVNNHTFSYAYGNATDGSSGAGFVLPPFTGDFVARYSTAVNTAISQVSVYFVEGGQPFQVGIWDATGPGGTPGNLLFTSTSQISNTGVYVMPILPAVPVTAGDFFVGVRQVDVNNIRFAYQAEDPVRTGTFYQTQPTGGTTWTDLAPDYRYRFIVEPKLQLPVDANLTDLVTPPASCEAGTVTYSVVVSNVGLNTIAAGAATVNLRIGGANHYNGSKVNTGAIAAGKAEIIHFTGVSLANAGENTDTAFVTLAGDSEPLNDTLKATNSSVPALIISTFPAVENAEAALPLLPNFTPVSGSSQLWIVHTGAYPYAGLSDSLMPHGGNKFYLFDSYGGSSSAGFISRLSSNCIALPAAASGACGYRLQFYMSHDTTAARSQADSLYVTVSADNGVSWTRLLPGYRRFNAAYVTPGWEKLEKELAAYAGQTIQLGFEGVSAYGSAFGLDDITIGGVPGQELILSPVANNGVVLTKRCDDQGWTYYSNPENADAGLFAVNWDPAGTGANAAVKAAAVLTIQTDPAYFAAEDIPGKKATYTMRRYWNLEAGAVTPTGPFNIRFFYDPAEKTGADNAAAAFATANAGTQETGTWFKTIAPGFKNDAAHVTPEGVLAALALTNKNTGNTINGILYAAFDSLTSLGGGTYASGVGPSTPLPVTLLNFDIRHQGKTNQLNWSTSLEVNTKKFIIERSQDGRNFLPIGEVAAAGTGTGINRYSFADNSPSRGVNYYRLRIMDIDNVAKLSTVLNVRNEGLTDITLFPNPVKATLHLKIDAGTAGKGQIIITDLSGKILSSEILVSAGGINLIPVKINKLAAGSYMIKIMLNDEVVIRKFNKQ